VGFASQAPRSSGPFGVSLKDVANLLQTLIEFCATVEALAGLDEIRTGRIAVPFPNIYYKRIFARNYTSYAPSVVSLRMESPLVLDLLTNITGVGGVGAAAAYLLKHPDEVGSWLPRVRGSWHEAQARADQAKEAHRKLREAGLIVEELGD
jgi:hypothetical protein